MLTLNQVHDVLPGSAIGMVYDDAEKLYAEVARDGKSMFKEAAASYLQNIVPLSSILDSQSPVDKGRIIALNTVHHTRREVVEIPLVGPAAVNLRSEVVQVSTDGSKAYALMDSEDNGGGFLKTKGIYADLQPATGMLLQVQMCSANGYEQRLRKLTMNLF